MRNFVKYACLSDREVAMGKECYTVIKIKQFALLCLVTFREG